MTIWTEGKPISSGYYFVAVEQKLSPRLMPERFVQLIEMVDDGATMVTFRFSRPISIADVICHCKVEAPIPYGWPTADSL